MNFFKKTPKLQRLPHLVAQDEKFEKEWAEFQEWKKVNDEVKLWAEFRQFQEMRGYTK